MKSQTEIRKEQWKARRSSKPVPTFAEAGSARPAWWKEMSKTERRAKKGERDTRKRWTRDEEENKTRKLSCSSMNLTPPQNFHDCLQWKLHWSWFTSFSANLTFRWPWEPLSVRSVCNLDVWQAFSLYGLVEKSRFPLTRMVSKADQKVSSSSFQSSLQASLNHMPSGFERIS